MNSFSFSCRTKTCFGLNALENIPFDLTCMGCKKPLIIQDSACLESGAVKALVRAFKDSGMPLGVSLPVLEKSDEALQIQFIKSACKAYLDQGHDALIALGGASTAQIARAVNMAVTFGPGSLASDQVPGRLSPFIFIPRTSDAGLASCGRMQFKGKTFQSDFMAPDQVVMEPGQFAWEDRDSLIDTALFCLALGSEICALSGNAAACAYARLVVCFSCNALCKLSAPPPKNNFQRPGKKKSQHPDLQKDLVQAAVMAGYLGRLPSTLTPLGQTLGTMVPISMGQAMCLVLPGLLETAAHREPALHTAIDSDVLLLALSGPRACSRVPAPQRLSAAIQIIRQIINGLHSLSRGQRPRTLSEAGLDSNMIAKAAGQLSESGMPGAMARSRLETILTLALTGRPLAGI